MFRLHSPPTPHLLPRAAEVGADAAFAALWAVYLRALGLARDRIGARALLPEHEIDRLLDLVRAMGEVGTLMGYPLVATIGRSLEPLFSGPGPFGRLALHIDVLETVVRRRLTGRGRLIEELFED